MTKSKLTILFLLLSAATQAYADQTNLVQQLQIHLSGLTQGPTVTNRNTVVTESQPVLLNDRLIIDALGAATGNSFSQSASLVVVRALPNGAPRVAVQDGAHRVDVAAYFVAERLSDVVRRSAYNLRTGVGSAADHSVERLALADVDGYPVLSLHFDVDGIAVNTTVTSPATGPLTEWHANVAGQGDNNGAVWLLQGTVRVTGHTLEVVTGGGGGV